MLLYHTASSFFRMEFFFFFVLLKLLRQLSCQGTGQKLLKYARLMPIFLKKKKKKEPKNSIENSVHQRTNHNLVCSEIVSMGDGCMFGFSACA